MKKLLILTAVALLASSATGCRAWQNWWRGACAPSAPSVVYAAPSDPCNPCDPCATAPMISPGPATYLPGAGM